MAANWKLIVEKDVPIRLRDGRVIHQIGMPYHWSYAGISTGDAANDLLGIVLDPNTHIQESKVLTCAIQPGLHPSGPALRELVLDYRRRAGIAP